MSCGLSGIPFGESRVWPRLALFELPSILVAPVASITCQWHDSHCRLQWRGRRLSRRAASFAATGHTSHDCR